MNTDVPTRRGRAKLSLDTRCEIVRTIVEGVSVNGTARLTGVTSRSVYLFRKGLSAFCSVLHDENVRGLYPSVIQCDECWSMVRQGRMERPSSESGAGAAWVWCAVDQHSRMLVSWHVGRRDQSHARVFLEDLRARCDGGFELVTDGCFVYPRVVEEVFAESGVAHITLNTDRSRAHRFSAYAHRRDGKTTNHVERQNFDLRQRLAAMRRHSHTFARSFSTLNESIAIYAFHYNFIRIQKGLRGTPAMLAGVTDHVWTVEELVSRFQRTELPVPLPPPWDDSRRAKQLATWAQKRAARLAMSIPSAIDLSEGV